MGDYLIHTDTDDIFILEHHGIKGQKWGVRRYQNPDGTLTPEGLKRYGYNDLEKAYKARTNIGRTIKLDTAINKQRRAQYEDAKGSKNAAARYSSAYKKTSNFAREASEGFENRGKMNAAIRSQAYSYDYKKMSGRYNEISNETRGKQFVHMWILDRKISKMTVADVSSGRKYNYGREYMLNAFTYGIAPAAINASYKRKYSEAERLAKLR